MFKKYYLLFLIISAFISISLFEIVLSLGILYTIYSFLHKKISLSGKLSFPIAIFASDTIISTLIFNPSKFVKSIEEGLFQFLYFFPINKKETYFYKDILPILFVFSGLFLLPVTIFTFLKTGKSSLFWGSQFEVGFFFSLFSISSLLLAICSLRENRRDRYFIYLLLFLIFSFTIFISFRRTAFLQFTVGIILVSFILLKNRYINKSFFLGTIGFLIFYSIGNYIFMSKYDYRFKELNKVIEGKTDKGSINTITSSRYSIFLDGIHIVKKDIENKNVLNILLGHGIRPGNYLPHIYDKKGKRVLRERYESFFLLSEFIERGLIGVISILLIYFYAFHSFFTVKIKSLGDLKAVLFFVPLILHLIGTTFTFFWDALLPLFLLLFKTGEVYFGKQDSI